MSGRRKKEIDPDIRSEFERDVDRISYNYYFRRLAEITQVSSGHGRLLRHNRMTHSLKVAQVGRRLVQYLEHDPKNRAGIERAGGIDRNVVYAAGLLHDAGHPPFGHIGEQQLNRLAVEKGLEDGYEGNAQTLRIVLSLTTHHSSDPGRTERRDRRSFGLDLTRAVVAACVKYPYARQDRRQDGKWGYYDPEAKLFEEFVAPLLPASGTPTLEAEIMDWADDITYAVHDLQDFYVDGIIPLHYLRHRRTGDRYEAVHQEESKDFWQYAAHKLRRFRDDVSTSEMRRTFEEYACRFPEGPYRGTRAETAEIEALASQVITDASKEAMVTPDGRLYVTPTMRAVIAAMKQVTWYYVIDHPDLVASQLGQRSQVNLVFGKLYKRVEYCFRQRDNNRILSPDEQWTRRRRLPAPLREYTEQLLEANYGNGAYPKRSHCYARGVIDYIASMTEVEFKRVRQLHAPGEGYPPDDDTDFYRGNEGS
ncbi:dGTP triphosphohydrolase [Plantactinospora endophytica]|uniref:dGTP triphosphohydrolase n=1 Tax=Plantactinospora endophytica TaxID=673535 RepID=UPI0019453C54|nr:dNTP triphosphohydrolase [Plantactinospora endophytica]